MRLEWADSALADRTTIYRFIDDKNPRAAAELDEEFKHASDRLREFPEMGRLGRVEGTRELVVHPRYIFVYELSDDLITIVAVLHASRQWPSIEG